jgi:hypothetical protein
MGEIIRGGDPREEDSGSAIPTAVVSSGTGSVPLRRLDWRFLLPGPATDEIREVVLLGGEPGLCRRVEEAGFAERVLTILPQRPTADAVIVMTASRERAREVMEALRPGGVLYWEVDRRRRGTRRTSPARLIRELSAAGATISGTYAALPNLARSRAFIPMEEPGALAWFVRTLFPPSNPVRWTLEKAALLLSGRLNVAIARFAPAFVVTATRDACPRPPHVLAKAALPTPAADAHPRPVVLVDDGNRLVMLPFSRGAAEPVCVLKVPKLPAFNDRTVNESEMLGRIRAMLGTELRDDVPEPLQRFAHEGLIVAVERYLGGESLDRSTGRWGVPMRRKIDDMSRAAEWLSRFHREVMIVRKPWSHDQFRTWIDEPLERYERAFGLTPDEQHLAALARAHARNVPPEVELPITWVHRDFNVWNVFRLDDRIRVIDWEGCRPGPALCDLLHFCAPWFEISQRLRSPGERLRGFARLFFEPAGRNPARIGARDAIGRYMRDLEIDARLLPVLLTYTWLELSLRRADQQALQGARDSDARTGNRFVLHVGVLARHADQLFSHGERSFAATFLGRS